MRCFSTAHAWQRVARDQIEAERPVNDIADVERTAMCVHQRYQLGHDELGDGRDVALALQHRSKAGQVRLVPVLFGALARRVAQVLNHFVDVARQLADFAARFDLDRARKVALRNGGRDFGDRANLVGELGCELVHVVGEIAPQTRRAGNGRLAAEASFEADFTRNRRHLIGKGRERIDHPVDRLGELRDFTARLQRQFALEVAVGDAGNDLRDAAHLVRQVRRHRVDVVGEVFPDAADALHVCLTAEHTFRSDFARNACDF
jgi:hypothetical protein